METDGFFESLIGTILDEFAITRKVRLPAGTDRAEVNRLLSSALLRYDRASAIREAVRVALIARYAPDDDFAVHVWLCCFDFSATQTVLISDGVAALSDNEIARMLVSRESWWHHKGLSIAYHKGTIGRPWLELLRAQYWDGEWPRVSWDDVELIFDDDHFLSAKSEEDYPTLEDR